VGAWFQAGFQVGFQLEGAIVIPPPPPAAIPGGGGGAGLGLPQVKPPPARPVPVVVAQALMDDLVVRYGPSGGRQIYFAMEAEHKGPFAPGNKYDASERPLQPVPVAPPSHRLRVRVHAIPPAKPT
jgi:hypothetical protein